MSEETLPPAVSGEAIPAVPATDTSPLNEHEAAEALIEWRLKRDEPKKEEKAAPEPAAAEPDTPTTEEAAPAEEATGEAPTETPEPEAELPPIEPPRSWTKEEKEEFGTYPREAQEKIARREQDRETSLRRGQNEVAEQRKAIEAERQKAEQARQQYEQAIPQLLQAVKEAQSGQFADIKSQADIDKMALEDWPRFAQYQAHLMKIGNLENEARQAQERQASEFKSKWSEFAAKEDAKFVELAPEMADKDRATKVADASVALLKNIGFSDSDLARLWNGEASLSLRDHRAQLLITKAAKYDEAQKSAPKKVAAKPVPPVQKPGAARPKGDEADSRIQNLEKQLERTGSEKVAAELLLAKRAARR